MHIPFPIARLVEQGIAMLLRFDPETQSALSTIDGKIIRVVTEQPELIFHLLVVDQRVEVLGEFDAEPDTCISGSVAHLLSLRSSNQALYTAEVKVSGDRDTAEALRHIISNVDVQLEEVLAPVAGDTVAHQIGRAANRVEAWLTESHSRMNQNTSEYLQEEVQLLAPNSEVAHFCNDVDQLHSDIDRLEARIALLEQSKPTT